MLKWQTPIIYNKGTRAKNDGRDDGRDMGGMAGEMMGEMDCRKPL